MNILHGRLIGLLFLFCTLGGFAQNRYIPSGEGMLVEYTYYCLGFDKEHKQANWVYYELEAKNLTGKASRKDNFRVDPKLDTWSATLADYKGSGYDRGHLCPAADMSFNAKAMSETFYMSNMSPQVPMFNRGIWKKLEEHVREWAKREKLYVVTGPIFKSNKGKIGKGKVTVPGYYYKLFYSPSRQQMIAYVLPNEESRRPINSFAVPVSKVEKMTGIDFFPQLPDDLEKLLEADTLSHLEHMPKQPGKSYPPTRKEQIIAVAGAVLLFLLVYFLIKHRGGKKKKKKKAKKPLKKKK